MGSDGKLGCKTKLELHETKDMYTTLKRTLDCIPMSLNPFRKQDNAMVPNNCMSHHNPI